MRARSHPSPDPSQGASVDEAAVEALRGLPTDLDGLALRKRLGKTLGPHLARRAAEIHALRRRAVGRFPRAEEALLTPKGLEQATRTAVAQARARRIAELAGPTAVVLDATCGVGADTLALAEAGLRVVAADVDPDSARCARANLALGEHPPWVVIADAERPAVRADVLVVDPDRRPAGRRELDPDAWSPSLNATLGVALRHRGACLKLHPAVEVAGLQARLEPVPHLPQWVSESRELCEVALWIGELAGTARSGEREALVLGRPTGESRGRPAPSGRLTGRPQAVGSVPAEKVSGIGWLLDPDPAVVRSGLLGLLAGRLSMAPLDPRIAFLGGDERPDTPFGRAYRVRGVVPADPRRVRKLLGELDVGPIQVLKRGHPDRAEVLERRFRGPGRRRGVGAVARLEEGHVFLALDPVAAPEPA